MGPNWVRRESAVEVDVLATDPVGKQAILSTATLAKEGQRAGRLTLAPRLPAPSAEDSLPVIPENDEELARLPAGHRAFLKQHSDAVRKGEAVRKEEPAPKPAAKSPSSLEPFRPSDYQIPLELVLEESEDSPEEQSTNLFESFTEEGTPVGGDMLSVDQHSVDQHTASQMVTEKRKVPHLKVVSSDADSLGEFEDEFAGVRASPAVADPRPIHNEVVDWPPPMERPGIDYPADWWEDTVGGTKIVLDPIRPARASHLGVMLIDAGAWLLGFVAMFVTGLVTTGSALLVLFALSLD